MGARLQMSVCEVVEAWRAVRGRDVETWCVASRMDGRERKTLVVPWSTKQGRNKNFNSLVLYRSHEGEKEGLKVNGPE